MKLSRVLAELKPLPRAKRRRQVRLWQSRTAFRYSYPTDARAVLLVLCPARFTTKRSISKIIRLVSRRRRNKIYETYLNSLPEPQQWSFREALQVVRYVESMQHFSDAEQRIRCGWTSFLKPSIASSGSTRTIPNVIRLCCVIATSCRARPSGLATYKAAAAMSEAAARVFDLSLRRKGRVRTSSTIILAHLIKCGAALQQSRAD